MKTLTVMDVACGDRHTVCVGHSAGTVNIGDGSSVDTTVYVWGDGSRGRLGLGDEKDCLVPTRVPTTAFIPNNEDTSGVKVWR